MITSQFYVYSCSSLISRLIPATCKDELDNWSAPRIWVFIAPLGEQCSANAEAMGSNPVEALKKFFRANICNCLNLDNNCEAHISISSDSFTDNLFVYLFVF